MLICVWFEQGRGAPHYLLAGGPTVSECWDVARRLELLSSSGAELPESRSERIELESPRDVGVPDRVVIDADDVAILATWPGEPAGLPQDPEFDISACTTPTSAHIYVASRAIRWLADLQWQGHVLSTRQAAQQAQVAQREQERGAIARVAGRLHVTGRIPEA